MANQKLGIDDIILLIKDSIEIYGESDTGISQMVKDLEQMIKNQAEMGGFGDEVRALIGNTKNLENLVIKTVKSRKSSPANNGADNTGSDDAGDVVKFKDAVKKNVQLNKELMVSFNESIKDVLYDINQVTGNKINEILGEEKENVIDPAIGLFTMMAGFFGKFKSADLKILTVNEEQRDVLERIVDKEEEKIDILKGVDIHTKGLMSDLLSKLEDIKRGTFDNLEIAKDDYLRNMREKNRKKEDDSSFIERVIKNFMIAGIAGLTLGATLRSITIPFDIMGGIIKSITFRLFGLSSTVDGATKSVSGFKNFFNNLSFVRYIKNLDSFRNLLDRITQITDLIKDPTKMVTQFRDFFNILTSVGDTTAETSKIVQQLQKIPILGKVVMNIVGFISRIVTSIQGFIASSPVLTKGVSIIGKGVKFLLSIVRTLPTLLTPIGMFAKTLAVGFKYLGWPLTILLGVIDFFKGFFGSNEETFLGKIKDGLKQVIIGFSEMPLRLLGWIYDKALQFLGIESKGTGDKLVSSLGGLIDAILNPIIWLFNSIKDIVLMPVKIVWTTLKNIFGMIVEVISGIGNIIGGFLNYIVDVVRNFGIMIYNMIGGIFKIGSGIITGIIGAIGSIFGIIKGIFTLDSDLISSSYDKLKEVVGGAISKIWEGIKQLLGAPITFIKESMSDFGDMIESVRGGVLDVILAPFNFMRNQMGNLFSLFVDAFEGILSPFKPIFDWLKVRFNTIADNVISIFDPIIDLFNYIGDIISNVINMVKDKIKKIPFVGDMLSSEEEKREKEKREIEDKIKEVKIKQDKKLLRRQELEKKKELEGLGVLGEISLSNVKKDQDNLQEELDRLKEEYDKKFGEVKKPSKLKDIISHDEITPPKKENKVLSVMKDAIATTITQSKHVTPNNFSDGLKTPDMESVIGSTGDQIAAVTGGKRPLLLDSKGFIKQDITPFSNAVDAETYARNELARRQLQSITKTESLLVKADRKSKEREERPIVVNVDNNDKRIIEPPEDIESMSILWLNKSNGLG